MDSKIENLPPVKKKGNRLWIFLNILVVIGMAVIFFVLRNATASLSLVGNAACQKKSNSFGGGAGTGLGVGMTDRTTCYWDLAINNKDSRYCYKIGGGDQGYHVPRCVAEVGVLKKDSNECKNYRTRTGDKTNVCESMFCSGVNDRLSTADIATASQQLQSEIQQKVAAAFPNSPYGFEVTINIIGGTVPYTMGSCGGYPNVFITVKNFDKWKALSDSQRMDAMQTLVGIANDFNWHEYAFWLSKWGVWKAQPQLVPIASVYLSYNASQPKISINENPDR